MSRKRIVRFVDLFSGAGGLAQGFRQASDDELEFRSVFAVESEPSFAASYAANFGKHVFVGKIEDVKRTHLPSNVQLVIGGPPCQGFSPLGQMSVRDEHSAMNELWRHYFKIVAWVRPQVFVIENVPEFLRSAQYLEAKRKATRLGYTVTEGVLNAWHFGVPQRRRRGFVIGMKEGIPSLPAPLSLAERTTVGDAIRKLAAKPLIYDFRNGGSPENGYSPHRAKDLHIGRNPTPCSLERYMVVPAGGNRFDLMRKRPDITPRCWLEKPIGSTDVFGRLEWDKPSLTIRTEFFKPEKGCYLHPELHRPITHWEAAKLQTFPDDYLFCGSKTEIARQIGNAVPPKLGEAVAGRIKDLLLGKRIQQLCTEEDQYAFC
jgi:DNA (cytosine-5)-methyltransferase 1